MKKLSVCVCCYNEEDNINALYSRLTGELNKLKNYDYEIIFSDNHSTDGSREILKQIAKEDKHVKVILNQTNFGISLSVTNAMSKTSGDAVISLPSDLQEPPELIPKFVEYWESGYDVVLGQKTKSQENWIKRICRKIYYAIIRKLSEKKQLNQVTGFGIIDRKVLDVIMPIRLQDPYISLRHLVTGYGFNIFLLPYEQQKRHSGKSSFNLVSYFEFAVNSLVNTSYWPIRMSTIVGFFMIVFAVLLTIAVIVLSIINHLPLFNIHLYFSIIVLFFGVILLSIGLVGYYLKALIRKVSADKHVVEEELINFE